MLAVAIRFLAGRYHATPWGRHVNEADVEWPPSPWRILRALIATWHRKIDPLEHPRQRLEALAARLSESPPVYRLPEAVHAHTRHYMPVRQGRADKPVLVFDAFLRLRPEAPLVVAWPGLELGAGEAALLDGLLERIGFLGRAESWVECRRLDAWDAAEADCRPGELAVDPQTGESLEPVRLLVPMPTAEYAAWRSATLERTDRRSMPARRWRGVQETLPEHPLDALRLETSQIQEAGWSRPPGAREVLYHRPADALAVRRRRAIVRGTPARISGVRFALAGKPLPRVEDSVRVGELARAALMHHAERVFGADRIPPVLSGHDLGRDNRHDHAFYLPEDDDGDGRIEHLLVHAAAGFPPELLRVFERLTRLYGRDGHEWCVAIEGVMESKPDGAARGTDASGLLGESTHWQSVTPYLHPWFAKRGFGYAEQIRRECAARGLAPPAVEQMPEIRAGRSGPRRPVHFHRFRAKRGLVQPDTHGRFLELVFDRPVAGPLALGFGCHFGLGLFRPVGFEVPAPGAGE